MTLTPFLEDLLRRRPKMSLRWLVMIAVVAGIVLGGRGGLGRAAGSTIVARVNGEVVERRELDAILADPVEKQKLERELDERKDPAILEKTALHKLIANHLVLQEAKRRGVSADERVVDQVFARLTRRFKDPTKLSSWLEGRGLDERSLRERIRAGVLMTNARASLAADTRPSADVVNTYYEKHKAELKTPDEVKIRVISTRAKPMVETVLAASKRDETLDRLLQDKRGIIRESYGGWVPVTQLPHAVRTAIARMANGEVRGPLRVAGELVVLRLDDRRPSRIKTLIESRAAIEQRLRDASEQSVVDGWIAKQEHRSKIEIYL
jgi:parvulin-like peptidyl-prolyl isomerase